VNTQIPSILLLGRVASVPEVEFHRGLAVSYVVEGVRDMYERSH
jgi:hypothetical protein